MALEEKDIRAIADYARISLKDEELAPMTSYMNDMLKRLDAIKEYDLEGVEPTYHPIGGLVNVMREDEVGESLDIEDVLLNAASVEDRSFKVPPILGAAE